MNPGLKIVLVALLLLAGGLLVYLALAGGGDPGLAPQAPEPATTAEPQAAPPPVAGRRADVPAAESGAERRTEITELTPRGDDCAQGVRGRVVDARGAPLGGIEVFLVEGQAANLLDQMIKQRRGVMIPPIARAESDPSGAFAVGLQKVIPDQKYELRLVSEQFADHTLPNLTIRKEDWVDVGDVALERGVIVHGRVTARGTGGLPVPDATVSVEAVTAFPSLSPTPGREHGITTTTDRGGFFRLTNVGAGTVTVTAVAPGYARVARPNMQVSADTDNGFDFELPKGMSIAGVVIDGQGDAVPGARVAATAISAKTPATGDARTDERGRFEVLGLVDGPYQLDVAAAGFVEKPVKPVFAGEQDERIVLERQGGARVKVVSKAGRLLTRYDVLLKRWFKDQDSYGNVMGAPPQQVYPANLRDGFYTVSGIDPGNYAFEVNAQGYAKTFSAPFTIARGGDEPEVVVAMNEGGEIRGTVTGHDGRPLGGATVTTLPNSLDENPFTAMFGAMLPSKVTRTRATTDAQGRYTLFRLTPGEYQLKFTHPQHYDVYQKGHRVEEAQVTEIPPLRMERGTVVSGTARVDGVPAGQVKVTVAAVADPARQVQVNFQAETVTDNQGRFVIGKRLPPGKYETRAARQTDSPLVQMTWYAKTRQEFTIAAGQESHTLYFEIRSD